MFAHEPSFAVRSRVAVNVPERAASDDCVRFGCA
jgi:hypothetical protein